MIDNEGQKVIVEAMKAHDASKANKLEWVVYTGNPEFLPQVEIMEIERGVFDTRNDAIKLANEIMQQESVNVQIKRRYTGVIESDWCWYNHQHYYPK